MPFRTVISVSYTPLHPVCCRGRCSDKGNFAGHLHCCSEWACLYSTAGKNPSFCWHSLCRHIQRSSSFRIACRKTAVCMDIAGAGSSGSAENAASGRNFSDRSRHRRTDVRTGRISEQSGKVPAGGTAASILDVYKRQPCSRYGSCTGCRRRHYRTGTDSGNGRLHYSCLLYTSLVQHRKEQECLP